MIDIQNPFQVPNIIDLDYYKQYKSIPLSSTPTEQDAVISRVIKEATLNINVVCGKRVFKRYKELEELEELSETQQYDLYCLQQAICGLVEYYIDNGMRFVDKNVSTSGNLPVNLNASSSDAVWEAKRLDIVEKLQSGGWYQTFGAYNPTDIECNKFGAGFNMRKLILQLDTIYKRIDNNNNFAGNKLVDLGNLTADKPKQTLIQDFNLFNCLWNGKDISNIVKNYIINLADNPNFNSEQRTITATSIKTTAGTIIDASQISIGEVVFINGATKPNRWYTGNNQFNSLSNIDISNKLDKATTPHQSVYVVAPDGTQTNIVYASGYAGNSTMVQRTPTGTIFTATPTQNGEATTKEYVDSGLAKKEDTIKYIELTGASGTLTQEQIAILKNHTTNYIVYTKQCSTGSLKLSFAFYEDEEEDIAIYSVNDNNNANWVKINFNQSPATWTYDYSELAKKTYVDTQLLLKANTSDLPTKTSDLTNDSDFTTKTYVDNTFATQTALNSKLDSSKATFQTTAPTSDIADNGIHIVYLESEPATKYSGYIYLIKE